MCRNVIGLILLFFAFAVHLPAVWSQPNSDLAPKAVKFEARELDLNAALHEIQTQTGNTITDRRTTPSMPKLTMPAEAASFWPTLDALCEQAGVAYSVYQPDGGLALVNGPFRKLRTSYSSLFRFALKRISVTRDDETKTRFANLTVEAAWEPRLKPLFLNVEGGTVAVGKTTEKLERQSIRGVAGTGAAELELRVTAPERAVAQIDSLKGSLRVIAIPKMLEFSFPKLVAKETSTKEGVVVTIVGVEQRPTRWTVDVQVEYPEGAIVPLESFQSWMDNNRTWLAWNSPTKKNQVLEPVGESPLPSGKGLRFRYDFTPRGDVPLPAVAGAYALKLTMPNRVISLSVPFAFQDLPLP